MTDINIDYDKLLKYYTNLKISQKKYSTTENGKNKINEASRRYYEMKKTDPEFMEKQRIRSAKNRELKKLKKLNNDFENLNKLV